MEAWEEFIRTGGIEEYLLYRLQTEKYGGEDKECKTSEQEE